MRFYNNSHPYYCGIDLHARLLYVCIIVDKGEVIVHKKIKDDKEALMLILEPYIGNVIVGVECMHCWYWLADWCDDNNINFVLGHALYMKAIHGGKTKNDKVDSLKIAKLLRGGNFPIAYHYKKEMRATRDLLHRRTKIVRHGAMLKGHVVNTNSQYNLPPTQVNLKNASARETLKYRYDDPVVQRNIDLDMNILDFYAREISEVEHFILAQARQHNPAFLNILKTIPGVGRILSHTILYEIGDIDRFDSVQRFASYYRLVKCKAESAGKTNGTRGSKIGNPHLK